MAKERGDAVTPDRCEPWEVDPWVPWSWRDFALPCLGEQSAVAVAARDAGPPPQAPWLEAARVRTA